MRTETPHQRATAAQVHEMAASRRHRLHPPARGSEPDPHQHLWAVPGLSCLPGQHWPRCHLTPRLVTHRSVQGTENFFFFTAFVRRNHYFPINIYFYLVPGHVASPRAAGWAQRLQAPHYQCQPLPRASLGGAQKPLGSAGRLGVGGDHVGAWLLLPIPQMWLRSPATHTPKRP